MTGPVVCVGETMALLVPTTARPLDSAPHLAVTAAGAESNVACTLAGLGHPAAWVSAVGEDPFGRVVVRSVAERGVDVSGVRVDSDRPTGLFAKDPAPAGSTVHYYRAGSAASALGVETVHAPPVRDAAVVHLSGVTPALSPACDALSERLLADPDLTVSFDVNHRARLWRPGRAAERLLELARLADVVLVGRDEAEELWGTATPSRIRALLPDVPQLVVKDAEHGATEFRAEETTRVPSPAVGVVEPVGAGDAFAAGYLAGGLRGLDAAGRLRLGHLCAGRVLRVTGDLADPPRAGEWDAALACPDEDWGEAAAALLSVRSGDDEEEEAWTTAERRR
ncbi:sugar kinase [Streptomonospora litoralis]|uniref:2-dehydro-3-deoxygluconokinase n=1 Tax=Streptomonospora litoralis TaxID=2498135 RepID=A0A4P6PZQ3_9ACTN|nr:sugar kinase [Streptomonospora litoralis]QBI53685.1 2-dehydro-3-deoxygluconokinase [Streptomonospora litoralis]